MIDDPEGPALASTTPPAQRRRWRWVLGGMAAGLLAAAAAAQEIGTGAVCYLPPRVQPAVTAVLYLGLEALACVAGFALLAWVLRP